MRRSLAILLASGLLLLGSLGLAGSASAATIASTTTCSNGVDNTGGLGLICEVTIANTITATGGSATVTVRECHGAAGDPEASCTTETTVLTAPVTAVTQCNEAINGGGGTLRCSVQVTNTFVGLDPGTTCTNKANWGGTFRVKQSQLAGGCRPVSEQESVGQAPPYTQNVGRGRPTYAEQLCETNPIRGHGSEQGNSPHRPKPRNSEHKLLWRKILRKSWIRL